MNHNCRVCGVELGDENWSSAQQKAQSNICKECNLEKGRLYRENNKNKEIERGHLYRETNPEKVKEQSRNYTYRHGTKPMNENKECTAYLGVHINERMLRHLYNDVEVMPPCNPGYDFVCGKGKKVDCKSSCLNKNGRWTFNIKCNTIADYFLLVAYDNRDGLNPLHIWLIPGHVLNHLKGTSIRPNTLDKWKEYEKPIDEVISCCDELREK